jgi:sugar/nucleoside kinase (ribokinase family)
VTLYVGFDQSFRDIIVKLFDGSGNLVNQLPKVGHHHRSTTVNEIAGGNGVNLFKALIKLNVNVKLVVPVDDFFIKLLRQEGVSNINKTVIPIKNAVPNTTIALQLKSGEIQLNNTIQHLDKNYWSEDLHNYWQRSDFNISTNWGLNKYSPEWISCQLLSSSGYDYEDYITNPVQTLLEKKCSLEKLFIVEPGLIYNHPKVKEIFKILRKYQNQKNLIILGNEEEIPPLYTEYQRFPLLIQHDSKKIFIFRKNKINKIEVPNIEPNEIHTTIGAGDVFLGGFSYSIAYDNKSILEAILDGIKFSQKYIRYELPFNY